jgi:hypothetical protein
VRLPLATETPSALDLLREAHDLLDKIYAWDGDDERRRAALVARIEARMGRLTQ